MGSAGVQDSSWGRWGPISLGSSHHVNYPLFLHQITLFFHSTGYKKSSWDKLRPYGNPNPTRTQSHKLFHAQTGAGAHRPDGGSEGAFWIDASRPGRAVGVLQG